MNRIALAGAVMALTTSACARNVEVGTSQPDVTTSQRTADVIAPVTANAIDSVALMRDISVLAHDSMEGRSAGTEGGAMARRFLEGRFREIGLAPVGGTFLHPFQFTGRNATSPTDAVNILGMVRGTERSDRYIVVTAHYDHVGVREGEIYNGADDNASGTAALLQIARAFQQRPGRHTVIFAALDAEERGLQGARAFVANPPVPKDAIVLNINMDMVGRNDAGELYVAGTYHYPQLLPLVESVAQMAEVKLIPGHDRPGGGPGDDWTNASDHGPFHAAGIPFLYFGVEDHPDYHRPTDDFERIQPGFYPKAVRTVLMALRAADAR